MSSINVLFYSNFCEGSKLLVSMMMKEGLLVFFHQICTDNNPKIPRQIRVTPTIMIRGIPTPYEAGDAFSWLAKIKQWKLSLTVQNMNNAQQQYLSSINGNLTTDKLNVLGFSNAEMSGMSDIFSFFSKNISQECQEAMPQTFFSCTSMGQDNIFTPPLENGSYKTSELIKINENKQREMTNKLIQERNNQDLMFKKNTDNFMKQHAKS